MVKKVLIVDDEPHMLRLTELSLKKVGYYILTARNGREAIEVAAREVPALIVMDLVMPELDGLSALQQLKATPATAGSPVIMLTSRGQTVDREEAETSGAVLFLTKPFSPSALATEARRIIGAPYPARPRAKSRLIPGAGRRAPAARYRLRRVRRGLRFAAESAESAAGLRGHCLWQSHSPDTLAI